MAKGNSSTSYNVLAYPSEDFIPYACYVDKNTILTKNGDLLVTFKIPSFVSNKAKIELFDIREQFRNILVESCKNLNISIYFTTVRKKADIIPAGKDENYFCKQIGEIWNKQNNWYNQFVNEIYVTVIISLDVQDNLLNPIFFLTSLTQTGINMIYSKKIASSHKILQKIISNIMTRMADYDIKLLSIVKKDDGISYSENMRFFSLLINLEKDNFPVTYDAISDIIRTKKLAYGSDVVEVEKDGEKRFASVITLKTFQDMTLNQVDKILQLPMELVITETVSFVDNKYVISQYEEQKNTISLSEDVDLAYISGLDDLVSSNQNKETDYCIGQTSIMVINHEKPELIENVRTLYKSLSDVGIVGIKENVYLPTIFWSQLPGNFRYIKRFNIYPFNKVGNYVSLFNFPTGRLRYNCWGNAITILPTALNTPYFFNFHNKDNGNTVIIGPENTGKTTIMNFLLSRTSKINPRIFYIDTMRSSEVFINAMGGKYYKISPSASDNEMFKMNPFMIEDTPENEKFLNNFIISLVDFQDDGFIEMGKTETQLKSEYKYIPNIIKHIFIMKPEDRSLENVAKQFDTQETKLIYKKLSAWYKKQQISFIFNHNTNTNLDDRIIGVSLKTIIDNENLVTPVVDYLFNIINTNLVNGEPFILAIDDALKIVNNKTLAPIFINMLNEFYQSNAMIIFTTDGHAKLSESVINEPLVDCFATEICLANPKATTYQKKIFGIQEEESRILSLMKPEERNFILKCLTDIVVSSINLKDFEHYKEIYSNTNVSINAMNKAKETVNSEVPEEWVPVFLKIMEEYDKAIKMKKLKENEINQMKWEEARSEEINKNKILSQQQ